MQIASSVTAQQQHTDGEFCRVERKSGTVSIARPGAAAEWYHVSEEGGLKRFTQYHNNCGQKLYQNGKPWGEWRDVGADKTLFLYSGEKGLGIYDAAGSCLQQLSRKPQDEAIVSADLYNSQGQKVYHSQSGTLTTADGTNRQAMLVIGPPPGLTNLDTAPVATTTLPELPELPDLPGGDPFAESYYPNNEPSPSDLPYSPLPSDEYIPSPSDRPAAATLVESQFTPSVATVITGEYRDRCGRLCYNLASNQRVWERPAGAASGTGDPSILLTAAEVAAGSREGGYSFVSNKHGVFRIKDGVVERQAVVARENWRTGRYECRCVAVQTRCGMRYERRPVWVEQSHSAVRLGWVSDPAVGVQQGIEKNAAEMPARGGFSQRGADAGRGPRQNSATPKSAELELARVTLPERPRRIAADRFGGSIQGSA